LERGATFPKKASARWWWGIIIEKTLSHQEKRERGFGIVIEEKSERFAEAVVRKRSKKVNKRLRKKDQRGRHKGRG